MRRVHGGTGEIFLGHENIPQRYFVGKIIVREDRKYVGPDGADWIIVKKTANARREKSEETSGVVFRGR